MGIEGTDNLKPAPKGFGGKKAAPFAKGGGRDKSHGNTAKGAPRKTAAPKKSK